MAGVLLGYSIFPESVSSFGLIPFLQGLGKGGKKFSLQMIHTPSVEIMSLGIFTDGQAGYKPFLEIAGVIIQNRFQAAFQKSQVAFELSKILFRYSDVPLLPDAEFILGQAEAVPLTELFRVLIIGGGTGPAPNIVLVIDMVICLAWRTKKALRFKALHHRVQYPHLGLPFELRPAHTAHQNRLAKRLLAGGVVGVLLRIGGWRPDDHFFACVRILCHGDNINKFAVIAPVVPRVDPPVRHLSTSFDAYILAPAPS